MAIKEFIFSQQDAEYRAFQCRLLPTVAPERVIGVRTPILRKYAKELVGTPDAAEFLKQLPHTYFEEDHLHAFLLEHIRDFSICIEALDSFLPYVDNWSTCDSMAPKILGKYPDELLPHIYRWLKSPHTYTVRYAIGALMRWYLDGNYSPEFPKTVAGIRSEEYYINMMIAWYFATALAKQPETILPYFEQGKLPKWTHNKAIQKSIESYRIPDTLKARLRALRK